MSIEERLHEIQHAINQARTWLDCTEALVKQLVAMEKPSLEILARAFAAAEQTGGEIEARAEGGPG